MIVISPAKRLSSKACDIILNATSPVFDKEAKLLATNLAQLSKTDLINLMNVSDSIAELNADRFKIGGLMVWKKKELFFNLKAMYLNTWMQETLKKMKLII